MRDRDPIAGNRLREAVSSLYGSPEGPKNQTQLAAKAGVSRTVLDAWWDGAQPSSATMTRVAEALGVPPSDLWLRWLGIDPPDTGLHQIAVELRGIRDALTGVSDVEDPAVERDEGDRLADEAASVLQAREDVGSRATPRVPRETAGSDR